MTNDYLNPVELFDLGDRPDLTPADLRKAKKRFLTEMQLDGRDDFDFHGRLYTRNDLDEVTQRCEDPDWLEAYRAAAGVSGMSEFLVTQEPTAEFDKQQLFNPRLQPILTTYFADAYSKAFGRAVASGDTITTQLLNAWQPERAGLRGTELYQEAYRNVDNRIARVRETIEAFVRNPNQPKALELRGMQTFDTHLPADLLKGLPPYFGDLFEKMVADVLPSVVNINNQRQRPKVALNVTRRLYALPHLADTRLAELKEIGQKLKQNSSNQAASRGAASSGDGVGIGRIIWFVIVAVIILIRIANCASRSNRYSDNSYYNNRYEVPTSSYGNRGSAPIAYTAPPPPPPPPVKFLSPEEHDEAFLKKLENAARAGFVLNDLEPHSQATIREEDLAPLRAPAAGVVEANVVLNRFYRDTIFHVRGRVMPLPGDGFNARESFQREVGRSPTSTDKESPFYRDLLALETAVQQPDYFRNRNAAIEQRRRERADYLAKRTTTQQKKPTIAVERGPTSAKPKTVSPPKKKPVRERPRTSFARESKESLLGPKAGLPPNYYLYQKNFEEDDGRLMKVRAATDDPTVSALVVWRDTLGLRQVRVPGNTSAPFTFDVARGQVANLATGYVVYGRRWSAEVTDPWGGKGWFREVIGYFAPPAHGAFVNGKKAFRKNLWLPTKKADPAAGISARNWLRGIKKL